ncbi:hypothetical protein Scep_028763 [Stephania cephalantha]|uniref:tRNA-uridine aminocarboxypropyltransferase n=1 Tax=Stephania cephalantha TaxID=152367 RepID=A0AAP0EAI9_9MAGN
MEQEMKPKRPFCCSCSKPLKLCICSRFKSHHQSINNSIAVTILQHSQEKNHPLNSTRIAALGLKNLRVFAVSDIHVDARFEIRLNKRYGEEISDAHLERIQKNGERFDLDEEECVISARMTKFGPTFTDISHLQCNQCHFKSPNFDEVLGSKVGEDAVLNGFVVKKLQVKQLGGGEISEDEEFEISVPPGSALLYPTKKAVGAAAGFDFEVKNLIVLDGTWKKAKRLYHENPWLKLLPHLKLDPDRMSLYGEVRHQPKAGCLSTIESIVFALKVFGEDGDGLDDLLEVFKSMIGDQIRCKDEKFRNMKSSNANP